MACSASGESLAAPGSGSSESLAAPVSGSSHGLTAPVSGSSESLAAPVSGSTSGQLVAAAAYGEGKPHPLRSLDYGFTRRLRLRRLLAYHQRYTYEPIYDLMKENIHVIFDVKDFKKLVKIGQWLKAASYLSRFIRSNLISQEAKLLISFHKFLMCLNDFADGKVMVTCLISDWILNIYREPALVKYPYLANLVADVLFLRPDHASAFLNWPDVRKNAAEMMGAMLRSTPELWGKLDPPRGSKDLYHVVPITSFRRHHRAKIVRVKKPAPALAQSFLQTKKRQPSENDGASHSFSGSEKISSEQLMELLDTALKAGSSPISEQGHIPKHFNECFPLVQMLYKFRLSKEIPETNAFAADIALAPAVQTSQIMKAGKLFDFMGPSNCQL